MTEVTTLLNIAEINKKILEIQKNSDLGISVPEERGEGIALLKNFANGTTSSGKPKVTGTLANIDEAKFNVWNNSAAYDFFASLSAVEFHPTAVWVYYSLSKYGLVINNIMTVEGYDTETFVYHKYNVFDVENDFFNALDESLITGNANAIIHFVTHTDSDDPVSERFEKEYAAYSHHDNCATGLLAHTTKCIRIYNGIKAAYPFLQNPLTNDLMVISLALHDIDKIYEMHDGVYQKYSFITHRGLGFEHLLKHKDAIVELYDEEFFYMLASVLLQHHGEYGENPRTIYALLVHMIDDMEAQLTSIDELMLSETATNDSAGLKIKYNGSYLNI